MSREHKAKMTPKSISRFFELENGRLGDINGCAAMLRSACISVTEAYASKMASISEILSRPRASTRVRECVMITGRGRWFYIFSENAPRPRLWPGVA
jgi:hypothetical protein